MVLVGFFVSDIGPLNQVVHLWAYDSLAHREAARATMAQTRQAKPLHRASSCPSERNRFDLPWI